MRGTEAQTPIQTLSSVSFAGLGSAAPEVGARARATLSSARSPARLATAGAPPRSPCCLTATNRGLVPTSYLVSCQSARKLPAMGRCGPRCAQPGSGTPPCLTPRTCPSWRVRHSLRDRVPRTAWPVSLRWPPGRRHLCYGHNHLTRRFVTPPPRRAPTFPSDVATSHRACHMACQRVHPRRPLTQGWAPPPQQFAGNGGNASCSMPIAPSLARPTLVARNQATLSMSRWHVGEHNVLRRAGSLQSARF